MNPRALIAVLAIVSACGAGDSGGPGTSTGPATVTITPANASVSIGGILGLVATVRDSNGTPLPNALITWTVASPSTASISASGVVSGNVAGTTTVLAQSGPAVATIPLVVTTVPISSLHLATASYLGGTQADLARDIDVDGQGNYYLTGSTKSADFPVTPGAFDLSYATGSGYESDAWVTKYSASGTLLWSTFVGGPNYERAYGIEVDAQGFVYIAGRAGAGMPITGGVFQPTFAGAMAPSAAYGQQDGFICKLAPTGASLVWCSYFGVADGGFIRDLDVDGSGNVYVAMGTELGGFPAAWFSNAYQPTKNPGPGSDIIVAKIKSDGTQVLWATYLGGSGDEVPSPSIRVDGQGAVYVAFSTTSTDMPLVNAAQTSNHGQNDFFLAKLSSDGSSLLFATYLGGSANEGTETHGLWVDSQGNAVIAGPTGSSDFPATAGVVQPSHGGGTTDMFVARYSPTGAKLAATLLGGSGLEDVQGISTDSQGNIYLSGLTTGTFPTTAAARGPGGGSDMVAVELSPALDQIRYAVRIGGTGNEESRGAVLGPTGEFLLVGQTASSDFFLQNAAQTSYGGLGDGAVITIRP